jgi:hypothetical protein
MGKAEPLEKGSVEISGLEGELKDKKVKAGTVSVETKSLS